MYFLWFLPAVLLAVSSCAVWQFIKANHREFSASSLSVFTIFEEAA
jgi:cytochrome c-type biogenesis protein CcmH/NrfF